MKRWLPLWLGLVLLGDPALAQVSISSDNTPVSETFNAFDGSGFSPTPGAGQLDSDNFVARGFSDGSMGFGDTKTAGDFARGTSTGSETQGGVYSFETSTGDFSLGVQPIGDDFTSGSFIVRYVNDTGGLIDDFNVEYEIKVYNDKDRSNSFNLSHASSGTCETDPGSLTFTAVSKADYSSPETADPSPSWQTIDRGVHVAGLNLASMDCFYLRFTGDDVVGNGSRDEVALDDLTVTANPVTPLPVELTAFTALADGRAVVLQWETASETNNAGFEIQHAGVEARPSVSPLWDVLGFVDGYGTTAQPQAYTYRVERLPPGRHRLRLKQIDFDGTFAYSPEVEVALAVPGAYHLSNAYPNPFRASTSFSISAARAQRVEAAVYDIRGRRVERLFEGFLEAGTTRAVTFASGALPGGLYLIRIRGEYFAAGQVVVLVK